MCERMRADFQARKARYRVPGNVYVCRFPAYRITIVSKQSREMTSKSPLVLFLKPSSSIAIDLVPRRWCADDERLNRWIGSYDGMKHAGREEADLSGPQHELFVIHFDLDRSLENDEYFVAVNVIVLAGV